MPLLPGASKSTISANIGTEIAAGKKPSVAAAIGYRKAGKYRKPAGTTGKRPRLKEYIGGT